MSYPKTLHLTNSYHASSGGISAFYRALFRYCNDIGRQIRLIVPGEKNCLEEVGSCGRIYYVRAPRSPVFDRRYRLIFPIGSTARETIRILRLEQPDVLEVSDKYALLYFSGMLRKNWIRGVNRPTEIATSHERMDDNVAAYLTHSAAGRAFARFYMRWIYLPQFDEHIANSEYTAAELVPAARGHTTPRGVWVCPMGLDVPFFTFREPDSRCRKRILYAGRVSAEKNVLCLIEVLERLPAEYSLVVAGDGPLRRTLILEAEHRCPGRLEMHGHFPDRQAFARLLHEVDAFIHPNPHEPFGITPLEAMASGLPVIAPNAGGVLSYANRDNCWLCDPTPEAFARTVLAVFSDNNERKRRSWEARRTAEQHDWGLIAQRYFNLVDSLHQRRFSSATAPGSGSDAPPVA